MVKEKKKKNVSYNIGSIAHIYAFHWKLKAHLKPFVCSVCATRKTQQFSIAGLPMAEPQSYKMLLAN